MQPGQQVYTADWLCKQLGHDLEKFLDSERSLRKPEHYLLISNVSLSSVAKTGGKAKIDKIFRKYQKRLRLKRFAVWSADELRALLEDSEDIRRAYTAWLTPSDVLAQLVERLARPNLAKLLPLSLSRDLRNERDVRLKDAGQETEKAIYLENVFIDLPLQHKEALSGYEGDSLGDEPNDRDEPAGETEKPNNIVANILQRASDKLDPASINATRIAGAPLRNRVVILGGPGQGKSTLSQFITQFERARLLSTHRPSLNPQTSDLIQPIVDRAQQEALTLDRPVRFPVRVNLPDYADAIQSAAKTKSPPSLVSFIAAKLSGDIDVSIRVGTH